MTIQTGITTNRKALARMISEKLLGALVTYAGVPSCAYRVGTCITIDRQGDIEITNDDAKKILMPFFIEQGWTAAEPISEPTVDKGETDAPDEPSAAEAEIEAPDDPSTDETETADEPDAEESETELPDEPEAPNAEEDSKAVSTTCVDPARLPEIENCRITIPAELTVAQLTNLVHTLYSKQYLLNRAAMDGRLTIPEALITRLKEQPPETLEAFSELLRDFKALDELDGFNYEDGDVSMAFPHDEAHPERWMAYAGLVGRIIHMAKEASHVKAELQTSENEKYYMRAWLLRLGYGGADLKAERRLLLKNLRGHSAFPNDAAAERHKEKYAVLRHAAHLESEVVEHDE